MAVANCGGRQGVRVSILSMVKSHERRAVPTLVPTVVLAVIGLLLFRFLRQVLL